MIFQHDNSSQSACRCPAPLLLQELCLWCARCVALQQHSSSSACRSIAALMCVVCSQVWESSGVVCNGFMEARGILWLESGCGLYGHCGCGRSADSAQDPHSPHGCLIRQHLHEIKPLVFIGIAFDTDQLMGHLCTNLSLEKSLSIFCFSATLFRMNIRCSASMKNPHRLYNYNTNSVPSSEG